MTMTELLIFLATRMFPSVLLIGPLLTQWRALGLIDSCQALIYSNSRSRCRSRSG
jgi:ABC-type glycerol-3-phosphate transport system permease component